MGDKPISPYQIIALVPNMVEAMNELLKKANNSTADNPINVCLRADPTTWEIIRIDYKYEAELTNAKSAWAYYPIKTFIYRVFTILISEINPEVSTYIDNSFVYGSEHCTAQYTFSLVGRIPQKILATVSWKTCSGTTKTVELLENRVQAEERIKRYKISPYQWVDVEGEYSITDPPERREGPSDRRVEDTPHKPERRHGDSTRRSYYDTEEETLSRWRSMWNNNSFISGG